METITIKAKPLNGQNSMYVKTGNANYSFEAEYEKRGERIPAIFVVEGINDSYESKISTAEENARYYALNAVDYAYSGYFIRESVKNFQKISNS